MASKSHWAPDKSFSEVPADEPAASGTPAPFDTFGNAERRCDRLHQGTEVASEHSWRDKYTFLAAVLDKVPATIFVKDACTRRYVFGNEAAAIMAGLPKEACVNRTDPELFPHMGEGYEEREAMVLKDPRAHTYESDFQLPRGETIRLRTKRVAFDVPGDDARYILGLAEDVTEMRKAQAAVLRLAHYDSLTGLLNRHAIIDRLDALVASKDTFALLNIDLDRFKSVNDRYGHLAGDEVLSQVGMRIREATRPNDVPARVGGDEFAVVVIGDDAIAQAQRTWERMLPELQKPIQVQGALVTLGATVGIAIAPIDSTTVEGIRHSADLALYRGKREGGGRAYFFCPDMDNAARDRQILERDLFQALSDRAITVAYQPVISTETGRITSVEALARWTHPVRGVVPPTTFIAIAEESGLIETLGGEVLRIACMDALQWPGHVAVAVNVSPSQIHARSFLEDVKTVLRDTGLPAYRLQLEITESLFISDAEKSFNILTELQDMGVKILLDDFGTGFSSLGYFERFSFDKVKIDKSFVEKSIVSRQADAIIKAVIGLGRALNMSVVAEGVETREQVDDLVAAGCSHLQGYFFSKPVPASTVVVLLDQIGGGLH